MSPQVLSPDALAAALATRDLTDPAQGPHAIQLVVRTIVRGLSNAWRCDTRLCRAHPIVPVTDNYDALGFAPDAVARDARYTRYASDTCVLRTHTSAMVPPQLRRLARVDFSDVLLACAGIVFRRDAIDRTHTGTPHQLDLWRIARTELGEADLEEMVETVIRSVLPGARYRTTPSPHPYTELGRQVDVEAGGSWVEVGECGLAAPHVLHDAGLSGATGLAMGLGLDRLLMLRKGIDDIRLLRSTDPRVATQMQDLTPYRPVSTRPAVRRDLSLAVDEESTAEALGDSVREALGPEADLVEEVRVLSEIGGAELPSRAIARLGLRPGQKNVVVRVVFRALDRTLTDEEANVLRDRVFAALHRGSRHHCAATRDG